MADYHVTELYSNDDACYVADIPGLRFCSALNDFPEQAMREVLRAKRAWLPLAKDRGKAITKPKYRPASYQIAR